MTSILLLALAVAATGDCRTAPTAPLVGIAALGKIIQRRRGGHHHADSDRPEWLDDRPAREQGLWFAWISSAPTARTEFGTTYIEDSDRRALWNSYSRVEIDKMYSAWFRWFRAEAPGVEEATFAAAIAGAPYAAVPANVRTEPTGNEALTIQGSRMEYARDLARRADYLLPDPNPFRVAATAGVTFASLAIIDENDRYWGARDRARAARIDEFVNFGIQIWTNFLVTVATAGAGNVIVETGLHARDLYIAVRDFDWEAYVREQLETIGDAYTGGSVTRAEELYDEINATRDAAREIS